MVFGQRSKEETAPMFSFCGQYLATKNAYQRFASDNERLVFVSNSSGKLTALSYNLLRKIWESDLGGEIISNVINSGENAFIITRTSQQTDSSLSQKTFLQALNKNTGITEWKTEVNLAQNIYLKSFENHIIIIDGSGKILSFSRTTGIKDWEQNTNLTVSATPHKFRDLIAIGGFEEKIVFVSLQNGQILETATLSHKPLTITSDYTNQVIFTGDDKGTVRSINIFNKKQIWIFRRGAKITSLQITDVGLLATSLDNFIYLIDKQSGELIWKRRLAGRITSSPLLTSQYIISASFEDAEASVINLTNGKLLNRISLGSGNFFTDGFLLLHKTIIFATQSGIFAFSEEACK